MGLMGIFATSNWNSTFTTFQNREYNLELFSDGKCLHKSYYNIYLTICLTDIVIQSFLRFSVEGYVVFVVLK